VGPGWSEGSFSFLPAQPYAYDRDGLVRLLDDALAAKKQGGARSPPAPKPSGAARGS